MLKFIYEDLGGGVVKVSFFENDNYIGSAMIDEVNDIYIGNDNKMAITNMSPKWIYEGDILKVIRNLYLYYNGQLVLLFDQYDNESIVVFDVDSREFTEDKAILDDMICEIQDDDYDPLI